LASDTAGQSYTTAFHATGGDGLYSFRLASGTLPKGMALSSAGVLSGQTTVAGSYAFTVQVSDPTLTSMTATEACTLLVNPGAISTFLLSAPSTVTAGTGFSVTVTAKDTYGNTATGYSGTVALTSSDGQTLSQNSVTISHGLGSATVALKVADTTTLTATSGSLKGTSSSIAVSPGAISTFLVSAPSTATAGTGFSVTVTVKDAYGNTVTGASGTVALSSSDHQTISQNSVTIAHGVGTATVALKVADTTTLTATAGSLKGTSSSIAISPAAVASFLVSAPSTATAGMGFTVTVTAKDTYGNTVTGYSGTVALSSGDQQTFSQNSVTLAHGLGTATVALKVADTTTLTATSGALKGTSSSIAVSPGALASFLVSAPSTATAGMGFTVTVTAKDAYGNTVTGCSGAVALTSSDGQTVLVSSSPVFAKGTATATVTLNNAGTVTLTVTAGTVKGVSGAIAVAKPATGDWFSQNMSDPGLQALARTDFTRDGSLTYSDMLDLFNLVESAGAVTTAELQSLQALVTTSGAAAVHLTSDVQGLTTAVVNGDPSNALFQGSALGNLKVGSSASQLQNLVAKWFLGADHATIDTQYLSGQTVTYTAASGTLFASGGPSYKDVYQGEEGDCWLLASFAETAAKNPSVIQSMFTDDGATTENGVQVHVWTVRFYHNGVASYLTVDNELPTMNGGFAFANLGQSVSNSSNVLWVALLEKAYAQVSASGWDQRPQANSYASLNGGTATTALPVITGAAESTSNPYTSASSFSAAITSGRLLTVASMGGHSSLGIVGDHDYAVLGYNASNQTFTLLNPWGWNNTAAPGILNLTWSQLTANFWLDGNGNPPSSAAPPSAVDTDLVANAAPSAVIPAAVMALSGTNEQAPASVPASGGSVAGATVVNNTTPNVDAMWLDYHPSAPGSQVSLQLAEKLASAAESAPMDGGAFGASAELA
jgi:hypothetical protein